MERETGQTVVISTVTSTEATLRCIVPTWRTKLVHSKTISRESSKGTNMHLPKLLRRTPLWVQEVWVAKPKSGSRSCPVWAGRISTITASISSRRPCCLHLGPVSTAKAKGRPTCLISSNRRNLGQFLSLFSLRVRASLEKRSTLTSTGECHQWSPQE